MLRSIRGFFSIGERKTFVELSEIIEIGRKANSIMVELIVSGASLTGPNEDIRLLEKQSDRLSFKIKEDIVNGAVNPNVLDNLLECVELADSMIDDYYFVSRELNRIAKVRFDGSFALEGPEIGPLFSKSLDLADQAMVVLLKILKTTDLSEVAELRSNIELLEQEGDNVKDDGFDRLYVSALNIHYLQFVHISELLHKFDDILDSCEDLADLFVSIMTSISK
jgi:uncharacterized protein Yka (UPF0111/DUF47 family)